MQQQSHATTVTLKLTRGVFPLLCTAMLLALACSCSDRQACVPLAMAWRREQLRSGKLPSVGGDRESPYHYAPFPAGAPLPDRKYLDKEKYPNLQI